jgi:hypothetical protein
MRATYTDLSAVPDYAGNLLIEALGPIPSTADLTKLMLVLSPVATGVSTQDRHTRLHQCLSIRRLFLPSEESVAAAVTADCIRRQSYIRRNPVTPGAWTTVYATKGLDDDFQTLSSTAFMVGLPGCSKTRTIDRIRALCPQIIVHEDFPNMHGPVRQVPWIAMATPADATTLSFALGLHTSLDVALGEDISDGYIHSNISAPKVLRHAVQRCTNCFLGLIILDEIQNLFRMTSVKKQVRARGKPDANASGVMGTLDDALLKTFLVLDNVCGIPLMVAGTPDGVAAFTKRMSIGRRLILGGFHELRRATSTDEPHTRALLDLLWDRLFLRSSEERPSIDAFLLDRCAGIPGLMVPLWVAAQRYALEKGKEQMSISLLDDTLTIRFAPVLPALAAIRSNRPDSLRKFVDLLPTSDQIWQFVAGQPFDFSGGAI